MLRIVSRTTRLASASPSWLQPVVHGRRRYTHAGTELHRYHDDELRQAFDSRIHGRELVANSTQSTGLFDNPYLSSPEGITRFAADSLQKAQDLAARIIAKDQTAEQLRDTVRNLDILSDTLCKVIDMVAFVRMSHPDPKFLAAAQAAHEHLYEYMNVLNTSVEMYSVLDRVLGDKDITSALSSEELQVGKILLADFKRSGVQLNPETRAEFVGISNDISILGQQFLIEASPVKDYVTFSSKQVWGLDPQLAKRLTRFGKVRIPTSGPISNVAMRTIADEHVRKELWLAQRTATAQQESYLSQMLQARAKLAKLMGAQSYGQYELQGKMIKCPENVNKFLQSLADRAFPLAQKELSNLRNLKQQAGDTSALQEWDREYYAARFLQNRRSRTYAPDSLSSYFSLGTVMQGLSRLFTNIYGIKLVPEQTKQGEVWHDDVRRLNVVSETEGEVGVIYCDLFEREGKSPNPAHFTVQCSRQVYPDEPEFQHSSIDLLQFADGRKFQKPIIALVCDFAQTHSASSVDTCALLTFGEVETLFHEMGHAIHSMLGRTALHNVSGTRCATDFVELPSVLMERFAADPAVLALYARHYQTGEPLPYRLLQSHLQVQATFQHSDDYSQIKLSMLDQVLHSQRALEPNFDPHEIYYQLERERGLFEPHRASQWHTYFGHLFGYGATYYCYLFDRAIADRIWKQIFATNPTSRESGEKFKSEVLAWGGSRDPWQCVANVLDDQSLASGDEQAILRIGSSIQL